MTGKYKATLTLAIGGALYFLLACAADIWVVAAPAGNRPVHLAILIPLGLAFIISGEGFLALLGAVDPAAMLGKPFFAAAVGSMAYSLRYSREVFVNYWYYDDWGYFRWLDAGFGKDLLVTPVNDHFVPLLKMVILGMDRTFGLDYIGAACLQQAAFLILVLALAHLLGSAIDHLWLLIILVSSFAVWPSYSLARTWFGGGFWLTASAALLAVFVLHAIASLRAPLRPWTLAVSALLAIATVFISSQAVAPAVYLFTFCAPTLWLSADRLASLRRFSILCAISLVPTALALWCRSLYVQRPPLNFSGVGDGSLIRNLGIFIVNKVLFSDFYLSFRAPVVVTVSLFVPVALGIIVLATVRSIQPGRRAKLMGLILGGSAIFVICMLQIGAGRRWSYDAVLNPYYATFPILGLWLTWGGVVITALALFPLRAQRFGGSYWTAVPVVAAVLVFTGNSGAIADRSLLPDKLRLIQTQRQFLHDLGAATCELHQNHRDLSAVMSFYGVQTLDCPGCREIIGPSEYIRGFTPVLTGTISRLASPRICPESSAAPSSGIAPADGASESPAVAVFLDRYFGQHLPPQTPAAVK